MMIEQKFHFPVKDLSLNYHLGKEKCQKATYETHIVLCVPAVGSLRQMAMIVFTNY